MSDQQEEQRLREDSLTARRNLRMGRKLAASQTTLSPFEQQLVDEYTSGRLENLVRQANAAYGQDFRVTRARR